MLLRVGLLFSLCFIKISVQTCHSLYRDYKKCDSIQDLHTTPNLTKALVDMASPTTSLQFTPDTIEALFIRFHSVNYIDREAFKSSQRLKVLEIDTNNIETIHIETFKNLPNLEVLALVHNGLESIQGSISDLPKLLTLNLAGNNLRDITLRNLSSLKNLHLNNNTFSKFEGAFLPELSVLHLHHNRLKVFDASQLHSLTKLYMANNLLTEINVKMFKNLKRLYHLDLRSNNILNIEHGAFEHTPELQVLILSQNSLTVLDGEVFPGGPGLKKLGSLFLDENRLQFMSMRLLGKLQQLKTISIWGNPWKCSCLDVVLMWCVDYDVNIECREAFFDGMRPVCVVSSSNGMSQCTFTYDAKSYTFFAYHSSLYPGGYNLSC